MERHQHSSKQQSRPGSCPGRTLVRRVATILAACFAVAAPGVAAAQSSTVADERSAVSYAVKFVCGGSTEEFQEGLVRGVHATAINILNPSFRNPVRFAKRVSRALPYQASGALTDARRDEIGPGQAIEVECNEIRQMLPQQMTRQFRTGFLLISATRPLVITAVYTSRPHNGDVSTIDVETISALPTQEPPDTDPGKRPDLVVQVIRLGSVNCPQGRQSCEATARIRIANIGTADATAFNTRTVLDPSQSVIVDHVSPAGLVAGGIEDFTVVTPPGGNCHDPDCRICATVDSANAIAESDETNNQLCREFPG